MKASCSCSRGMRALVIVFAVALPGTYFFVSDWTTLLLSSKPLHPRSSVLGQNAGTVDWDERSPSTCSGYFGNGFTANLDLVGGLVDPGEFLRCRSNSATRAFFCRVKNLHVNPSAIKMSRGGERLQDVMGRTEAEELPEFEPNSISILLSPATVPVSLNGSRILRDNELPPAFSTLHADDVYKYKFLAAARVRIVAPTAENVLLGSCQSVVTAPVIFLTRMEYVNLYHTSTDWYNAWLVARIIGFEPTLEYAAADLAGLTPDAQANEARARRVLSTPRLPLHVVFLDGHNAGPLDDGWLSVFFSVNYIKHFADGTCFSNGVLAPFGYHAPIIAGMESRALDCPSEPHLRQFSNDVVLSLGLNPRLSPACDELCIRSCRAILQIPPPVLFVRRTHYVVHPRHGGKVVRRIENEEEVLAALHARSVAEPHTFRIVEGDFARMSFRDQVIAAQLACVIVGAHGAGLTHVLFAPPSVRILELRPPGFVRPHFISASHWAGARHTDWLTGTSRPGPQEVVSRVLSVAAISHRNASHKNDG